MTPNPYRPAPRGSWATVFAAGMLAGGYIVTVGAVLLTEIAG